MPAYSVYSCMYCVLSTTVYASFGSHWQIRSGTPTLRSMLKFDTPPHFMHSLGSAMKCITLTEGKALVRGSVTVLSVEQ